MLDAVQYEMDPDQVPLGWMYILKLHSATSESKCSDTSE